MKKNFLGVLDATDGERVGSVNAFDVDGVVRDAQAVCVCLAVFILAPEAGAPAEVTECAVVEAVASREREEPERILAGLEPEAGAAQFAAGRFGVEVVEECFPFLCARDVPAFRCQTLVVLFPHLVVHFEVPGRSLFGEFCRDVQHGCPCVESSECLHVRFFVVGRVAAFACGLEAQVVNHPFLVADFDGAVCFAVACIRERPVLERFGILGEASAVRNRVLCLGRFVFGRFADPLAQEVRRDGND